MEIIASILLLIDGVIYNAIKYIYNIFNFMAGVNIFNDAAYQDITAKIYTILGLIMMFVLAYTLLKAVMNPDDFAKGEKSFPNIIKNVIISLVLIVVMPAIFSFAMDFQASILNNNTIYKFVLGRENLEEQNVDIGSQVAYYTFTSFFYPSEEFCTDGSGNMTSEQATACKSEIKSNGSTWYRPSTWFSNDVVTLAEVDSLVESGQASFTNYNDFSEAVADNEISYSMIISTVAGVFVLYVLLNFCFDVAVRVIKLAFYQLIAPIPIICRILPGGNMKDVFDKWTKQTISVYVEVFIRIAIMALGVYLITLVIDAFNTGIPNIDSLGFVARMIVRALLIMAVIIFIRQAPKLIGDIFHLDTGGMKLGLMDKLAMGGVFAAGGAVGSLISSRGNPLAAVRGLKYGNKNKDFKVIGQEAAYASTKREAYQNGVTRRQIMGDRLRKSFGFNTKYEQAMKEIDYQAKDIDEQIEAIKNQIEAAKELLLTERVSDRLKGNNDFIKVKDEIENRVKKKLAEEKSNYTASISYEVDELYDTGNLDSNGNHIMATRRVTRTETGNLDALRKFIQKNQHNLNAEQVTKFSQAIASEEKRLVSQYVTDNVTQAAGTDGAGDHVLENLVADIRSDGILNSVMMDASGQSQLSANDRNDILTSAQLWNVLDNLGGNISNEISALNRQTANINQQTIGLEHEISELNHSKQEIQAQKVNDQNRRYRSSSDIASKPPGGSGNK